MCFFLFHRTSYDIARLDFSITLIEIDFAYDIWKLSEYIYHSTNIDDSMPTNFDFYRNTWILSSRDDHFNFLFPS